MLKQSSVAKGTPRLGAKKKEGGGDGGDESYPHHYTTPVKRHVSISSTELISIY